jgi:hypothetical protein
MQSELHKRTASWLVYPVPLDIRLMITSFSQYRNLDEFRAGFISHSTPAYQKYKTALTILPKPNETEFRTTVSEYFNAVQAFFGLTDLLEAFNSGRASNFWFELKDQILCSTLEDLPHYRRWHPSVIFGLYVYPVLSHYGIIIHDTKKTDHRNEEMLLQLKMDWEREAAALRAATGGIEPKNGILPLAVMLACSNDYKDFLSMTTEMVEPAWDRMNGCYRKYSKKGRSELLGRMLNHVCDFNDALHTACGFLNEYPPPSGTMASRLFEALSFSVANTNDFCKRMPDTPQQSVSEGVESILNQLPEEFFAIFFQRNADRILEINRYGISKYLIEESLAAGHAIPLEILVKYPNLLSKYGG